MRISFLKLGFWESIVIILMFIFTILVIGGMWNNAATYDEVAHLPAGYACISKGDYRFNPEHPPLVKMMAALPLLTMTIPALEKNPHWNSNNEWQFGRYFLYQSGINADRALFYGRLMMLLLSLPLAFLVFYWSKELYGKAAGVFSLFLFAFEPNLIAHSQVIHTDLGFSLFMTSSLFFLWKARESRSKLAIVLAGLCFGLALATKYSALVLLPIFFLLILLHLFETNNASSAGMLRLNPGKPHPFRKRLYLILFHFPIILPLGLMVLAAFYGFFSIDRYFDGFSFVLNHNEKGNPSFLFGMYSDSGWWYYFPLAFLIKTSLPIIIFFSLSLLFFFQERLGFLQKKNPAPSTEENHGIESGPRLHDEFYLLLPASLFLFLSLFSRINIGIRHILPFYPLIMIFSGRYIHSLYRRRTAITASKKSWKVLSMILMIWLVASAIFIFPYQLSYFNELVLGPKNGYKYLVDSNLDWGQDLIRLKKFLDRKREDSLIFSYCGSADPHYYGIKYQYLPGFGLNHPQDYPMEFHRKEFIAVSATNLQSVFFNLHDTYDWLKKRKPYARIGYSIFVWEISHDASAHDHLARIYQEFGYAALASKHRLRAQHLRSFSNSRVE